MTNMASFEQKGTIESDQEDQHCFQLSIPKPGHPPLMIYSGNEAYSHILELVKTNKFLVDRAIEVDVKATEIVGALRSLANLLNLRQNKSEETKKHLATIERFVKTAENNIDLAFKVKRVRLLKFDTDSHLDAETDLATAEQELHMLKEDLDEYIGELNKLKTTRKVIQDCINAGFDVFEHIHRKE